jgi:hypothetical protein
MPTEENNTQAVSPQNDGEEKRSHIPNLVRRVFEARGDIQGFCPSTIVTPDPSLPVKHSTKHPLSKLSRIGHLERNPNYLGQMTYGSNQDPNLPEFLNTAVWIEGIPAAATLRDLLRSIKQCDRIFTAYLNRPNGAHQTSAAKIAFFTRHGAVRFLSQVHTTAGIRILGQKLQARPNRNKYHAHTRWHESRVLRIRGPAKYVNYEFLQAYIASLVVADVLDVFEIHNPVDMIQGVTEMEWTFGSVLAQAAAVKLAIEKEPALMELLQVRYCPDPCE